MIYLFNCVRDICSLPATLCTLLGQLCAKVNCRFVQDCCNALSQGCNHFTEKPLGSYLLISWVIAIAELYNCFQIFSTDFMLCKFQDAPVDLAIWTTVQMGFAVVNLLFAPLLLRQVWQRLMERTRENPPVGQPPYKLRSVDVQAAFKDVFLHELGVLFFFFASLASVAWSWKGGMWIHAGAGCQLDGSPVWAVRFGMSAFCITCFYSIVWYFCTCCAGSVTLRDPIAAYNELDTEADLEDALVPGQLAMKS